jgi:hypothetical protein
MRFSSILLPLVVVLLTSSAYASSITLGVTGTLTDGTVLGGTLTVDQTAGTATVVDLTLGSSDSGTFPVLAGQGVDGRSSQLPTGAPALVGKPGELNSAAQRPGEDAPRRVAFAHAAVTSSGDHRLTQSHLSV